MMLKIETVSIFEQNFSCYTAPVADHTRRYVDSVESVEVTSQLTSRPSNLPKFLNRNHFIDHNIVVTLRHAIYWAPVGALTGGGHPPRAGPLVFFNQIWLSYRKFDMCSK